MLPHCLKNAEGCPADYDEFGLDCRKCGACSVADFKTKAEDLGYKVLVSEGTPIVLKIIVSGHVDAIVGVACLNVLEKAIDKILLTGIPCVAAPLLSSNCKSTSVDDDWVSELIESEDAAAGDADARRFVHLLRLAHQICEEPELSRLAPRHTCVSRLRALAASKAASGCPIRSHSTRASPTTGWGRAASVRGRSSRSPLTTPSRERPARSPPRAAHRRMRCGARPWPSRRSTRRRWFTTTSRTTTPSAMAGPRCTGNTASARPSTSAITSSASAIASSAANARNWAAIAPPTSSINLSDAHLKLSEGQGAELLWRDARDKTLTALDALKIYALKTAPAFEAALYAGLRLAGPAEQYEKTVADFSKNLGVAFQILNDLKDWDGDDDNKLIAGQDVLAARPTLLLALALEGSHRRRGAAGAVSADPTRTPRTSR